MVYSFNGHIPVIHPSSFVHPLAAVTGNVIIGKDCYIGHGAAIRVDWGDIILEDGVNVQENCTVHMLLCKSIVLQKDAQVDHVAIIHGANLGESCMVGMNSVNMDDAFVRKDNIVGAMAFVKTEMQIPERSLVVGNPAKVIRELSDDMIAWKTAGTRLYQQLPADCHANLREVETLTEISKDRPKQEDCYKTIQEFRKKDK